MKKNKLKDKKLEKIVNIVVETISPYKIILFGSRSHKTDIISPDSDYDLLILKRNIKEKDERLLAQKIYVNLIGVGVPVDLLVKSTLSLRREIRRSASVVKEALNSGKVVYEQNK
ncbi:MAG: nucleotidyltransferase domain-containing protein [Oligoflexia bacterium]|nr:nucleotidyltransferase domain-containing protein [Oligoflexia bacterium]